ncbi:ROK family transcriptional regulator [Streptomyces inhibens]|uniref:ROK family transcriptional regulator n=1 Tax=Streptomyces inhibens TaxID=2293571 RepID=UPI001EE77DCE|nr:ROK family transcriptional regulator [Streptomyces inhibens]UKY53896.1 ROK family protein [Streptomyces inhibens]
MGAAQRHATTRDLRRGNRSVLLWSLYFDGPLSRQELGARTGLSGTTVSTVTAELLAEGLVVEAGAVDSDGGRPRILLRVAPDRHCVIGVDVGETRVRVELYDLAMNERARADHPLESGRYDVGPVVERILAGLDEVIAAAAVDRADILGVGVAVSGVVERAGAGEGGALVHGQTFDWHAVPLGRLLREGTAAHPGTDLPLHIENGATTLGQAEMWFGAGRGADHAVIALIGSGVGAAVVANGSFYHGATSSAGEWGHTVLQVGGRRCRCGARGCLEAYVGAEGILDRYHQARRGRPAPGVDEESALAALIAGAEGSAAARRILDETAVYLGAGIANLVNLFNPRRIILGGWAGLLLGARLLPQIRAAVAGQALRHPYERTSIELCRLGPDAVALGAATLPVERFLAAGGTV